MLRWIKPPRTWVIIQSNEIRNAAAPSPAMTPTIGLRTATRPAPGVAQRVATWFRRDPRNARRRLGRVDSGIGVEIEKASAAMEGTEQSPGRSVPRARHG